MGNWISLHKLLYKTIILSTRTALKARNHLNEGTILYNYERYYNTQLQQNPILH